MVSFYGTYYAVIDFVLYAMVFTSVARVTLEKAFSGRPGRALSVAVGLILALSLSVAERTMGFNIGSFGPIGAGIVIALVGVVVFRFVQRLGAGSATAGSLSFIIVYFALRAAMPGFYHWMDSNPWASFLHSLLVLAILVALWRLISSVFRSPGQQMDRFIQGKAVDRQTCRRSERATTKQELHLLNQRLSRFTRATVGGSEKIIRDLQEIIAIVREHGTEPAALQPIAKRLHEIEPKEHQLSRELARIRKLDQRLKRLDLSNLKGLQADYAKLSGEGKQRCRERFLDGRQKINIEGAVGELAHSADEHQKEFRYALEMAVRCLMAQRADDAVGWLERAIERERGIAGHIERIQSLEKRLINLVKRSFRQAAEAQ